MKRLTQNQLEMFQRDGVLIVEDFFDDNDLAPVHRTIERWIDQRAHQRYRKGTIRELHVDAPFEQRTAQLWAQDPAVIAGMDICQSRLPALYDFHFCPKLLDAVEDLIGPEISINPIAHVRAKMPDALSEDRGVELVPWHQDAAVTWEEADASEIITCWIPLVDATEANGCMRVLPGVHRRGYLTHEKSAAGTAIRNDVFPHDVKPLVAACRRGGIVFMTRYTPHQGLVNHTDQVRWSLDLRYHPTGQPSGRPFYPSFVARSITDPAQARRDHPAWCRAWEEALLKTRGIGWHRTIPVEDRVPEGFSFPRR